MRSPAIHKAWTTFLFLSIQGTAWCQVGRETTLWKWTAQSQHHQAIVKVSVGDTSATGVLIKVDREKPLNNGGFEGLCLTAYHVVEAGNDRVSETGQQKPNIKVKYRNGRGGRKSIVLDFDKELDVAILRVWVPDGVEPAKLADSDARSGDPLELAGPGGNSKLQCCLRHFSAAASPPTNDSELFADVALLPGDSGGPVFNDRHEVVGVISGGWFWWDGGVTNSGGSIIHATWPARACKVSAIRKLLRKIQPSDFDGLSDAELTQVSTHDEPFSQGALPSVIQSR